MTYPNLPIELHNDLANEMVATRRQTKKANPHYEFGGPIGALGIVLGLEVSRLARNSADRHRLLELCAVTDTLILDDDGLYDPGHFNDRSLLGLKGTMSEAELYVLRGRLRGGILSNARRTAFSLQPRRVLVPRDSKDGRGQAPKPHDGIRSARSQARVFATNVRSNMRGCIRGSAPGETRQISHPPG